jgi:hypothetical protein
MFMSVYNFLNLIIPNNFVKTLACCCVVGVQMISISLCVHLFIYIMMLDFYVFHSHMEDRVVHKLDFILIIIM